MSFSREARESVNRNNEVVQMAEALVAAVNLFPKDFVFPPEFLTARDQLRELIQEKPPRLDLVSERVKSFHAMFREQEQRVHLDAEAT